MSSHIPVEIQSISTSTTNRSGYSLVLKEVGGNRKIQMIVGTAEAQNIVVALERIVTSRPMTHQFIQSMMSEYSLMLKYILIYKYEEGIFYAKTVCEDSFATIKEIDCRPSDAICMALRLEKPILVLEEVFVDNSMRYLEPTDSVNTSENLEIVDTNQLQIMLNQAIENEQFELAAQIKNEINNRTAQ